MCVSTALALLAAAGAAAGQGAANASAKALGGAKQQLLLAPVVQHLGASPCGGDIALAATTISQGTILLCANRLDYNLQLTLSGNAGASAWALFIAWGDACLTGPTGTGVFEYEVSVQATAANPNPFLTGFCLTNNCCGAYICASPPCAAATLSVDYTAPSSAVCAVNNQALDGFPLSTSKVLGLGCSNVANNYKISFTLSNPGVSIFPPEQVSVFTASGDRNCGTNFNFDSLLNGGPMPPGFTPSASVIASNSNSFQLTSLCTAEPCCAIVWCEFAGAAAAFPLPCSHSIIHTLHALPSPPPFPTHRRPLDKHWLLRWHAVFAHL